MSAQLLMLQSPFLQKSSVCFKILLVLQKFSLFFIFLVKLKVNLTTTLFIFLIKCVENNPSKRDVGIQRKQLLIFHILPFLSVHYLKSILIYVYFKKQDWI